ncbi:MAG: VOC family protein [Armatimonadota bacterium]
MAKRVQVVFDCLDPARLSRFWAEALGYRLSPPPEGFGSWEEALTAWGVPREEWNSASAVEDPEGAGPRIYFQRVETPKREKNRVHLDVDASGGTGTPAEERWPRIQAEVERLRALGAVSMREGEQLGVRWVVMQDPEGNEFCVH